jgi:hypothetical protein
MDWSSDLASYAIELICGEFVSPEAKRTEDRSASFLYEESFEYPLPPIK